MNASPDSARDEILTRLHTALAVAPAAGPGPVPREYRTTGTLVPAAVLDLLADRLTDYKAVVHRCTPDELAPTVAAILTDAGVGQLVLPPDPPVQPTGWDGEHLRDDPATPLSVAALDTADAVLTGCALAIAETGTLVLDAAPDQGRRALTLIPDHHLAVVHADQVVQTVPEAVHRLEPARPLTWISGPSATSDIELSRVEGVHGPRRLDVILVAAPPAA